MRRRRNLRWRAASLLALALRVAGGVSGADRPAWARMGSTPPPRSAQPAPARPLTSSASTAVARKALPPLDASGQPATSVALGGAAVAAPVTGAAGNTVATATPGRVPARPAIDPAWIGVDIVTTRHEDTLLDLAVDHGLGFLEVAMANPGVDPWLPGEGTQVVLPKTHLPPDGPRQGLVLNLPEQRLYYYQGGKLVRSYPIGIGRDGHATPVGATTVARKTVNPVWRPTPSARADDPELPAEVPAGPDNPLGSRALYLGWSSYLIHGTNKEYSIGRRGSRGCIRMYEDDVRALYDHVAVGTQVTTLDQPVKVGWIGDQLYIEASPTIAQVRQWEEDKGFDPVSDAGVRDLVLRKAGKSADQIDWAAVDRAVTERRGIVTRITGPEAPIAVASTSPSFQPYAAPAPVATAAGSTAGLVPSAARPSATATATKPATRPAVSSRAASAQPSGDELVKWLRQRLSSSPGQ